MKKWVLYPMESMNQNEFYIAIIGKNAQCSGWIMILGEMGLPFQAVTDLDHLTGEPALFIILNDANIDPRKWEQGPALFDCQYPPAAKLYSRAWTEYIFIDNEKKIIAPTNIWAIQWNGEKFGHFEMNPGDESPLFPVVCFQDQHTFLLGNLSETLVSYGYSFRTIGLNKENEDIQVLHPSGDPLQLKDILVKTLCMCLDRAGLPAVTLSNYPPGQKIPFLFRVDVDYFLDPELAPIRAMASDHQWKISAFFNLSGEELWEDLQPDKNCSKRPIVPLHWLSSFVNEGHEVGSHGFYHRVFPEYRRQLNDLRKTKRLLEDYSGGPVYGNAFPGGVWNPIAGTASRTVGFLYSTEASLAWHGYPFFPLDGNGHNFPMQIPCSPLYPACYVSGKDFEPDFIKLFSLYAHDAAAKNQPVSLMGHPFDLETTPSTLWNDISNLVSVLGCQPMTMVELYKIAFERSRVKLRILRHNGAWRILSNHPWEIIHHGQSRLVGPDNAWDI